MKTSITYNENPGSISEDEDFAQWFFEDKNRIRCAACGGSSNDVSLLWNSIPLCGRIPSYTETVKEAGTAETVTVSQNTRMHGRNLSGWNGMDSVEVTPKYENIMGTPYYETQETAVSNSSSSDQSLENDDKKKQEKQQEQKHRKKNRQQKRNQKRKQ